MSSLPSIPIIHPYEARTPMILRGGETITQGAFLRAALALAETLPQKPFVINLCRDRYYFSLGFCAALIKGATTLLPPGQQPRTIAEVAARYEGCYCIDQNTDILDRGAGEIARANDGAEKLRVIDITRGRGPDDFDTAGCRQQPPEIAADQLAAIAFTSGSTGRPKPNRKPWFTLAGTARMLSQRFFDRGGPRPVIVATVPSQHMYGLEMTVMMALQGRAVMHSGHPFYPRDVAAALDSVARVCPAEPALGAGILVTTPVHLRAMVGADTDTTVPAARVAAVGKVGKIISATAPLDVELAHRVERLFEAPVEEIFGCTEAGSMATRRTSEEKPGQPGAAEGEWTLLDGMNMRADTGGYTVAGPQLHGERRLEDRFEKTGERTFRLLGRASDQINVAGKRASLADLTQRLLDLEGVEDAVMFVGDGAERPAALVVSDLSERQILKAFSRVVDPVFLPRPIRKVKQLPRNETGKVTREQALRACAETAMALDLDIPPRHPCFDAHFPGNPIVPGALLLQWILAAAKRVGAAETIAVVKAMKFLNPVKPGDRCRLEFNVRAETIKMTCLRSHKVICKGVLCAGRILSRPGEKVPDKAGTPGRGRSGHGYTPQA